MPAGDGLSGAHGYSVETAHNGAQELEMILEGDYQAVILDVMIPQMDGFEVLKQLRRQSDAAVQMLTARGDEAGRIVGLEPGGQWRAAVHLGGVVD